jgi:hypothetical protein
LIRTATIIISVTTRATPTVTGGKSKISNGEITISSKNITYLPNYLFLITKIPTIVITAITATASIVVRSPSDKPYKIASKGEGATASSKNILYPPKIIIII